MQKEAINKKVWDKIQTDYQKFLPPLVPSRRRIKIYKDLLKGVIKDSGNKVLLLGATPAIRDLLAQMKFDVTLIDVSLNMIKAMTRLRKINSKERKIIGNWLEAETLIKDKFDCVIGDAVTNNLIFSQYPVFFQKMKDLLKPSGSLILCHCGKFLKKKMTVSQLVKKAESQPRYFREYANKFFDYFLCLMYDPRIYRRGILWLNGVNRVLKEKKVNSKLYSLLAFDDFPALKVSLPTQGDFKKTFAGCFKLEAIKQEKNCHPVYYTFHKIYQLRPKKK